MCKGEKQVYVQRLAHINQGSLLQTILTVGNKWGAFLKKKIGYTVHTYTCLIQRKKWTCSKM